MKLKFRAILRVLLPFTTLSWQLAFLLQWSSRKPFMLKIRWASSLMMLMPWFALDFVFSPFSYLVAIYLPLEPIFTHNSYLYYWPIVIRTLTRTTVFPTCTLYVLLLFSYLSHSKKFSQIIFHFYEFPIIFMYLISK